MKTAIEWLQSQFENTDDTELVSMNIEVWFKIAKEMEKQQIIKANEENMMSFTDGEQYYNETFNKGQ